MRRTIPLLALIAAAIGGCGADDVAQKVDDQLDPVAAAAEHTLAAGGADLEGRMTVRAKGVAVPMRIVGTIDFADDKLRMLMDIARSTGDLTGDEAAKAGFPFDFAFEGSDTMYLQSPEFSDKLPDGKSWLRVNIKEVSEEAFPGLEDLTVASNETNPAEMLKLLKSAGEARKVGTETIGGARTTRWRAVIDVDKYVASLPEDERDQARKSAERLKKAEDGQTRFPTEVWIDGDGLIRRETAVFTYEKDKARGKMVLNFKNFRDDVDVKIPSDDDTYDATDEVKKAVKKQTE